MTPSTLARTALPRWATPRNPDRPTYGPAVAEAARRLGRPLLPWQQLVADVTGEILPTGRMAYPIVVLLVPRRAGKTQLVLSTAVQRCSALRNARAWYTAQTGADAGTTFVQEWAPQISASPLDKAIRPRLSNGSEMLRFPSRGSTFGAFAPTEKALHGKDSDLAFIDEAWAFPELKGDVLEAAIRPTMLTRPARQLWIVSAGGTDDSTYLLRYRDLGRSLDGRTDAGIAYFEWHPPVDDLGNPVGDLDDPRLWAETHPAVGYTIDLDTLKQDRLTMGDSLFRRSILNVFQSSTGDRVLPELAWNACHDKDLDLDPGYGTWLSYDVAPDRSHSSIVLCRRVDGRLQAELVAYDPGVDGLADRVAALHRRHRCPVVADGLGPASTVTRELTGKHGVDVYELSTRELIDGCAELLDDVLAGRLQIRSQPPLDSAAGGAARRELGDGWAWRRKLSTVDISPLVALTIGAHRARHVVARAPRIVLAS